MSVEFNNQANYNNPNQPNKGLAGKLVDWGIAKNAKQANKILTSVAVVIFIVAILNFIL